MTRAGKVRAGAAALLAALAVALYGNTLNHPLVFDDIIYLAQNPLVKDAHSFSYPLHFSEFARRSTELGLDTDLSTNLILRPVSYLTLYLNYAYSGLHTASYRVINIGIHAANAVLVFLLFELLLRKSCKPMSPPPAATLFIPLAAALLFVAHPLQTESVTYIIQRFTSFGTFWYLLTVWLFFHAHGRSSPAGRRSGMAAYCLALLLGMLSKEIVFTAPMMIVILDWLVMGSSLRTALKKSWPLFLFLPLIPVLIVLTAQAQHEGAATVSHAFNVANPDSSLAYQAQYIFTEPRVVLSYLRRVLLPYGLNVDPDYPPSTSATDPRLLAAVAVIILMGGAAAWLYRQRANDPRVALGCCGVIWYFLTLAIDSSVVPLPDLMAEHRSYLPSIGAFVTLACGLDYLRQFLATRGGWRWVAPAGLAVWVVLLGAATISRNQVWSSELLFWKDAAEKSPKKARPWSNLGVAYYQNGDAASAVRCFSAAIAGDPKNRLGYRNLAVVYNLIHRPAESKKAAEAGLKQFPEDVALLYAMGVACCGLGDIPKGVELFNRTERLNPRYLPTHLSLGQVYEAGGRFDDALAEYRAALNLSPGDKEIEQMAARVEQKREDQRIKSSVSLWR